MFRLIFRKQIIIPLISLLFIFSTSLISSAQETGETDETGEAIALFNQGQDAHEKGDLKGAVEFYQKALKIIPEFPEAEYQIGAAYLALNQNADAEKSFRRAIELREDWSLPMASLGALLVQKDEFAEAEKILTKAVEIDEMNSPAFVALTDLRLKTKAAPEVLKIVTRKTATIDFKSESDRRFVVVTRRD